MEEKRVIEVGNYRIPYILEIKKVKNINLRMNGQGVLIASCNAYVPKEKVDAFVKEKAMLILQKQQRLKNRNNKIYEEGDTVFYLFDTPLQIKCIPSSNNKVTYDKQYLYVYYKDKMDIHKNIVKFIELTCKKVFPTYVDYYYGKLQDYHIPYPKVFYKTMSSRWGSCTPKKGHISLNKRMIHYDTRFLEYVVLHELVHFIQPNHSKSFYQIIAFHMPDYKERSKIAGAA